MFYIILTKTGNHQYENQKCSMAKTMIGWGGGGSLKASCELKERLHTGMQQVNN